MSRTRVAGLPSVLGPTRVSANNGRMPISRATSAGGSRSGRGGSHPAARDRL